MTLILREEKWSKLSAEHFGDDENKGGSDESTPKEEVN